MFGFKYKLADIVNSKIINFWSIKKEKLYGVFPTFSERKFALLKNNHRKQYSQTTPINSIEIIIKNIFTDLYVVPFSVL